MLFKRLIKVHLVIFFEGIFGDCSTYVDHFNYFTSCQFDLCYTHELNKVICASVQEYIILCQTRNPGAVIGEWRNLIEQCCKYILQLWYCNVLNMYMKALVSYVTTLYYTLIRLHHNIRLWVGTLYCSGMNMYLHM